MTGTSVTELLCEDCGYRLAPLSEVQAAWARRTGVIPRPPCPGRPSGLHRVAALCPCAKHRVEDCGDCAGDGNEEPLANGGTQ
ncbi:MAG: hypothetical protein ACJ780_28625 [Solirubrobacteraceae bacterium]